MTEQQGSTCPFSGRAATFDPFGEAYQRDPAAALQWSRKDEPVFYSPVLDYWVVTRYEDVREVFARNDVFSASIALDRITPPTEEALEILRSYQYDMKKTLVNEEEPFHMERRRALMEPFTPSELQKHEPMVRRLTREYVDRFVDRGRVDLVDEMLFDIPLTVALHFLGVHESDMEKLRKYSVAHTVKNWGRPSEEEQAAVATAVGKFWQHAGKVVEALRKDPSGSGWMPYTLRKQQELPDVITDSYVHSMMMAGIVAAHETTANAAGNMMRVLLERRELWKELCANQSLIPNAVEECLRHSGSVVSWRRLATRDTKIGDTDIPAGAKILVVMASANRDPEHFPEPDRIDLRRDNSTAHLTFGYGSHQCMGKNIARMELRIFLEEFTTRLPHLHLVEGQQFTYVPNTSFRGPEHLWVEWDPARNPERINPDILDTRLPVLLGEDPKKNVYRDVVVDRIDRKEAVGVAVIELRDESGKALPVWWPGAHIEIECGGFTRHYSLCGDWHKEDTYMIAVLLEEEGRGGSRFMHSLEPGDALRIRGPRNHFKLDESASHHVLIAGGIGITPIIAMADRLGAMGESYELHYAGRSADRMAYRHRIARDHADHSSTYPSVEGRRLDLVRLLHEPHEGARVYVCGPQRLIDGVAEAMCRWPPDSMRAERFSSDAALLDPEVERSFDVVARESGVTVRVENSQTVLEALRNANIDVPSDCEEGLCGTCEVMVVEGEIDHRDMVLTETERAEQGSMMTCCSRAKGDQLVLRI